MKLKEYLIKAGINFEEKDGAITGACEAGTKHFVGGLKELKPRYTIAEIIELTDGQFGATDFRNFFERG